MIETTSGYDEENHRYVLKTAVSDTDLRMALKPESLMLSVHHKVADEITALVMERLAPAINKAIDGLGVDTEEDPIKGT